MGRDALSSAAKRPPKTKPGTGSKAAKRRAQMGSSSDDENYEPAHKTQKCRGDNCICSSCGARAKDTKWASHVLKKGGGMETAYDDKCAKCWQYFKANLESLMEWDRFCDERRKNKEFDAEITAALEKEDKPDTESEWKPEDVTEEIECGLEFEKWGLFLTTSQFTEKYQVIPSAAGLSSSEGYNDKGKKVIGVIVGDESRPYMSVRSFCKVRTRKAKVALCRTKHSFKSQGDRTFHDQVMARRSAKNTAESVFKSKLLTFAEIAERIKNGSASNTGTAAGDMCEDDADEEVRVLGEKLPSASPGKTSTRVSEPEPLSASKSACCLDIASADGLEVNPMFDDSDQGANKTVSHWIKALDLQAILNGKKVGREKGFANSAVIRLASQKKRPDASRLTKHLQAVAVCEKLAPKMSPSVSDEDLDKCLTYVQENDIDIPPAVMTTLVNRLVGYHLDGALNSNQASMKAYVDCLVPFRAAVGEGHTAPPITLKTVTLADTQGSSAEKVVTFTKYLAKKLLAPLVYEGEGGKDWCLEVCRYVEECIAKHMPEDEDADEGLLTAMLSTLESVRAIVALLDPKAPGDQARIVETVMSSKGKDTAAAMIRNAIADTEFYTKLKDDVFDRRKHSSRLLPLMREAVGQLKRISEKDPNNETVEAMLKHVEKVPEFILHLRSGACNELLEEVYRLGEGLSGMNGGNCKSLSMQGRTSAVRMFEVIVAAVPGDGQLQLILQTLRAAMTQSIDYDKKAILESAAEKVTKNTQNTSADFANLEGDLGELAAALKESVGITINNDSNLYALFVTIAENILAIADTELADVHLDVMDLIPEMASRANGGDLIKMEKEAFFVKDAVALSAKYNDFMDSADDSVGRVSADQGVEQSDAMYRLALKVEAAMKQNDSDREYEAIQELLTKVKYEIAEIGKAVVHSAMDEVRANSQHLGGMIYTDLKRRSLKWSSGLPESDQVQVSWDIFISNAESGLLNIDMEKLAKALSMLTLNFDKYKVACLKYGLRVCADTVETAERTLMDGRVVEITSLLTRKLVSGADKIALRSGLIGIMSKLKSYKMSADKIHPVLVAKVEAAKNFSA